MLNILRPFFGLSSAEKAGMFIGFLLVENNIALLPNVGVLYYGFMLLALLFLLLKEQISLGSLAMWGLYLSCLASITVNEIPSFFQPYQRLATFLLITLLVSPVLYNNTFSLFRIQTFAIIIKLLQWIIVASVIYSFMGFGYKLVYFQGITNHSMILGPFAALCALFCIFRLLANIKNRKRVVLYSILLLLSVYCVLQAASRTAFMGTVVSIAVLLIVYYRNELGKYFRVMVSAIIILIFTFPVWSHFLDKLEKKNQGNTTALNINSREEHWNQRLKEFNSSPFWGIGFSTVSVEVGSGSSFSTDGKVETGSSWLSILSMTGIFGFTFFLIIFIGGVRKAWLLYRESPLLSALLVSYLCFWAVHMMAEGYIFAGGNSLAFCVWLTLGVIYSITRNKELAYDLQQKLVE